MRNTYLFLFLMIVGCQFNIAPPMDPQYIPVAEKHYRNYFERNREDLDIVEGVWTEYVVGSLYEDGKLIQRKEIPRKARWVVIKKGAQYQILNEYGEQNKFVASFKPTRDKNIFTFDCLFLQSKDHIRVKATLIEGKRIEMAYDAPKGIFAEHYSEFMGEALKSDPAKTLQLYWQFNWLKTFPK